MVVSTIAGQLTGQFLAAVDAAMRAVVDSVPLTDEFDVLIRYPLGWVEKDGAPYDQPTGKRIRPLLLLLCAESAGGDWRRAVPAAAAVELLHNFSLIHDDIEDSSETRHGRPTVWMIWGRSNAINAGDALFSLAYTALERLVDIGLAPELVLQVWRIFNQTNIELTRGQHLDMRYERLTSVSVDDYISMIIGKSAALVAACAQIGALIGSEDPARAGHYRDFGLNLGIAFQIRDDILGVWGNPQLTGKSAATDILSRKKSLPILYGLERSDRLRALYTKPKLENGDVEAAVLELERTGALAYAQEQENLYHQRALSALDRARPQGEAGIALRTLVASLLGRQS